MERRTLALLVLLLIAMLVPFPASTPSVSAAPGEPDAFASEVLALINAERDAAGLAPLTLQRNLVQAANWLAADMAAHGYVSHADRLGRRILARLPAFGYPNPRALGENVAAGYTTPAAVVAAWMALPGHRANILSASYTEIGVSYCFLSGSTYGRYWVTDFGSQYEDE